MLGYTHLKVWCASNAFSLSGDRSKKLVVVIAFFRTIVEELSLLAKVVVIQENLFKIMLSKNALSHIPLESVWVFLILWTMALSISSYSRKKNSRMTHKNFWNYFSETSNSLIFLNKISNLTSSIIQMLY